MKHTTRILSFILAFLFLFSLGGCGSESAGAGTEGTSGPVVRTTGATEAESTAETAPTSTSATVPTTEPVTEPVTAPTTAPSTESSHSHSYQPATCTAPKTCSVCGATEGSASGHNYANGKCTVCSQSDPNYTDETMVWIPTKGGTKYHKHAGCSNMSDPEHVTQSEAESRGFTPCKKCY